MSRLWVRISNCSRDFLSMWGELRTVNRSIRVGSGTRPETRAPVRLAVWTMSRADWSMASWSKASIRILMRVCRAISTVVPVAFPPGDGFTPRDGGKRASVRRTRGGTRFSEGGLQHQPLRPLRRHRGVGPGLHGEGGPAL